MKITLSKLWIIVLPIVFSLHLQKVLLFIFMLLTLHEAMHILCAYKLGYETKEVCIYPFGLSAMIKDFEYKNSYDELLITLAGLSVHIIMYGFLCLLSQYAIISYSFMLYLNQINMQIFCFNLIPIYPLDGGRILANLLELLFVYTLAKRLSLLLSLLFLLYYIKRGLLSSLSGVIIAIFFMIQLGLASVHFAMNIKAFYLYRYLHKHSYPLKVHAHKDIYKNKTNVIIKEHKLLSEREFLSRYI
ncbi:MAG: hypothetical protein EOM50_09140 [Erysipelotrichia bacterium]|nr:hypothetical protein [Erysipelotrichia bacterium]NCC55508.1 hypothetical protein [Erysipelotrichia bacterium]